MKIKVEIDENLPEDEILIRCRNMDEEVIAIQKQVAEAVKSRLQLNVFKGETEYYLTLDDILFFETNGSVVAVHTGSDIFETKLRLYELEEILSDRDFIRISKSQIVNINCIKSLMPELNRSLSATLSNGEILTVSRRYVKSLRNLLGI